jgi:hypothetical protein
MERDRRSGQCSTVQAPHPRGARLPVEAAIEDLEIAAGVVALSTNTSKTLVRLRQVPKPPVKPGTRWRTAPCSIRSMACEQGLSQTAVSRIQRAASMQLRRQETFKLSSGPCP